MELILDNNLYNYNNFISLEQYEFMGNIGCY